MLLLSAGTRRRVSGASRGGDEKEDIVFVPRRRKESQRRKRRKSVFLNERGREILTEVLSFFFPEKIKGIEPPLTAFFPLLRWRARLLLRDAVAPSLSLSVLLSCSGNARRWKSAEAGERLRRRSTRRRRRHQLSRRLGLDAPSTALAAASAAASAARRRGRRAQAGGSSCRACLVDAQRHGSRRAG